MEAYDTSLTKKRLADLSYATEHMPATTVGKYALFVKGSEFANAYDTSLTLINAPTIEHYATIATTVLKFALFAGAYVYGRGTTRVSIYDESLTVTQGKPLSGKGKDSGSAAATVGMYALFAGGIHSSNTVDVYEAYD